MSSSGDSFNLADLESSLSSALRHLEARSQSGTSPPSATSTVNPSIHRARPGVIPLPPGPPPPPAPSIFPSAASAAASGVGLGSSGEFTIHSGGGSNDLPVFILTPDLQSQLCLGVVNYGTKFCLQGKDTCTYSSHAQKASTLVNHIYIATYSKTAFSNHKIDSSMLNPFD
jgi:hypothetical protein